MGKTGRRLLGGALALMVVLALLLSTGGAAPEMATEEQVAEGVAYLRQLEARDPAEVEAQIKAIHRAQWEAMLQTQRDAWVAQLKSGEINVWSLFKDAVILGDSRAVGFEFYDFLPDERVMAEGGATIRNVADHLEELKELNPSYVFLCYGLNDSTIGLWSTTEDYLAELVLVVDSVQQALPEATVCVSSILVARDPAFQKDARWRQLPELSEQIRQVCEAQGYPFADNSQLCADYAYLWEPDGIHVQRDLYPYWAANLMIEVYDYEMGQLEAPAD